MRHELRLRPEAEADLAEAATWYESQRPGLGHAFLDQVAAVLAALAEEPRRYPKVHRGVRRALLSRFPFGVFYHIEPDRIVVLAVMHASRHPRHWKRRV